MVTSNISFTKELYDFAKKKSQDGKISLSEYIRKLIHNDKENIHTQKETQADQPNQDHGLLQDLWKKITG